MHDDKRVHLPGLASSRGEISLPWDHITVLSALHRTPFASCAPSVGDRLVASLDTWIGSNEWEQAGKAPPAWHCESDMVPTSLKGFGKNGGCAE